MLLAGSCEKQFSVDLVNALLETLLMYFLHQHHHADFHFLKWEIPRKDRILRYYNEKRDKGVKGQIRLLIFCLFL